MDGLPPVGTECEMADKNKDVWAKCRIVTYSKLYAIVELEGRETVLYLSGIKFRPLKSERELAIEQLYKIIWKEGHIYPENFNLKSICADIFDAGYRKIKDAEK